MYIPTWLLVNIILCIFLPFSQDENKITRAFILLFWKGILSGIFLRKQFMSPCVDFWWQQSITFVIFSRLFLFTLIFTLFIQEQNHGAQVSYSFNKYWFCVGFVLFIFLIFCVVFFVLFVFVLCLVYPMLPVSLDCPFFIAPLVFSNVYWMRRFYIKIINSLTVSVRDDDYSWHVSCTLNEISILPDTCRAH